MESAHRAKQAAEKNSRKYEDEKRKGGKYVKCTLYIYFDVWFWIVFFSIFPSISVFGLKFFNFPFNFDENDDKATKDRQLGYHFYFWMEGMVKHFARLSKMRHKKKKIIWLLITDSSNKSATSCRTARRSLRESRGCLKDTHI